MPKSKMFFFLFLLTLRPTAPLPPLLSVRNPFVRRRGQAQDVTYACAALPIALCNLHRRNTDTDSDIDTDKDRDSPQEQTIVCSQMLLT